MLPGYTSYQSIDIGEAPRNKYDIELHPPMFQIWETGPRQRCCPATQTEQGSEDRLCHGGCRQLKAEGRVQVI